jgi:hypothetical protein
MNIYAVALRITIFTRQDYRARERKAQRSTDADYSEQMTELGTSRKIIDLTIFLKEADINLEV